MVMHKIRHAARHVAKHPMVKQLASRTDVVIIAAVAILALSTIYSIWQISDAVNSLGAVTQNITGNSTNTFPPQARLDATLIQVPNCPLCSNFTDIIAALNSSGATLALQRVPMDSAAAQLIMRDFNLTKLPALYVTGDTNRTAALATIFGSEMQANGFFMEAPTAPYYNISARKLVGLVNVVVINDSTCDKCAPAWQVPDQLGMIGVALGNKTVVEYNSTRGQQLIARYNITHVPVVIFSDDINYYPDLMPSIRGISDMQADGSFVMQNLAPYRELSTGKVRGIVDIIYLNDSSCPQCYNVTDHDLALKAFGMKYDNRTFYDLNSTAGAALVYRYNITAVPTILISPEASVYSSLVGVWPTVGTVEGDGWFVFRKTDVIGTYHNLATGQIVNGTTE